MARDGRSSKKKERREEEEERKRGRGEVELWNLSRYGGPDGATWSSLLTTTTTAITAITTTTDYTINLHFTLVAAALVLLLFVYDSTF